LRQLETWAEADLAKVLTFDEARRIAANIAKLPDSLAKEANASASVGPLSVPAPQMGVLRTLSRVNRHAVASGYTYWPSTRSISSNVFVHDETLEWRPQQFASLAILQLCLVETEANWLADKTGGTVALLRLRPCK
jgi:hypothetical protein